MTTKQEIALLLFIAFGMLGSGVEIGYEQASELPHARQIVLENATAEKNFTAQFSRVTSPDFIQELTDANGGKHVAAPKH